jgi:plasmid maintenance system antidote protein VapI
MEIPRPFSTIDPASAATAMLARNLASQGIIPDPAVKTFLSEMDESMQQGKAPVNVPTSNANIPTLAEYQRDKAESDLKVKTLRQTEIAIFMLANRDLSVKDVADRFSVTPATITRIVGTDGFQYILAEEAKKLSVMYKGMRTDFELKLQAGAYLALERLVERIQGSNDVVQLLAIVSKFAELMGMGIKNGPMVQVNQFGVTGEHLRHATMLSGRTLENASAA